MSYQIIKQPNGKYCVFSTIVNNTIIYNCTKNEVIEIYLSMEKERVKTELKRIFEKLNKKEKPYYQFTISFEEMIKVIKKEHGIKEYNEHLKICN